MTAAGRPVVVLGQAARDLVLLVDAVPDGGGSTPVRQRIEILGGKGANQAVACAQLGLPTALVAVLGEDEPGSAAEQQARADGLDTTCVVRRGRTALLVDVVEVDGPRRLLEDVPPESVLRSGDVDAAAQLLQAADTVSLQLQQPAEVMLRAARCAGPGAWIVLDGAPDDADAARELLALAQVLRVDAQEAELLTGAPVTRVQDARRLLERGPQVAAVGLPGGGDLVVWPAGEVQLPRIESVTDPTGGGDTFTAALIASLRSGAAPAQAARAAARATASTIARLGGRPALTPDLLR